MGGLHGGSAGGRALRNPRAHPRLGPATGGVGSSSRLWWREPTGGRRDLHNHGGGRALLLEGRSHRRRGEVTWSRTPHRARARPGPDRSGPGPARGGELDSLDTQGVGGLATPRLPGRTERGAAAPRCLGRGSAHGCPSRPPQRIATGTEAVGGPLCGSSGQVQYSRPLVGSGDRLGDRETSECNPASAVIVRVPPAPDLQSVPDRALPGKAGERPHRRRPSPSGTTTHASDSRPPQPPSPRSSPASSGRVPSWYSSRLV